MLSVDSAVVIVDEYVVETMNECVCVCVHVEVAETIQWPHDLSSMHS